MSDHVLLSLQLTEFSGKEREILIPCSEDDDCFDRARSVILRIGEHLIREVKLGFVENDGTVTPWLTEDELLLEYPF